MRKSYLTITVLIFSLFFLKIPFIYAFESLSIVSFNIKFLGHYKKKDNKSLAKFLKQYDIVVIQELVSPPFEGTYPDGTTFLSDNESKFFFDEMKNVGFEFEISPEDTGKGATIHKKSSATEWFVTFYKPDKVFVPNDLPDGFLEEDRSNNPNFHRVPYAFPFRSNNENLDFVLISVHLAQGSNSQAREQRKKEFDAIYEWIEKNNSMEKDFIVLGDMNIEKCEELAEVIDAEMRSLNEDCIATNLGVKKKPFDHVFYYTSVTEEIPDQSKGEVIDIIKEMEMFWDSIVHTVTELNESAKDRGLVSVDESFVKPLK